MMTEYAIRPIGTPLGPEDAASKYYECINWMCAEAERLAREREELKIQLNNIARIVANAKADFSKSLISTILVAEVDSLIADLEAALVAKEDK